MKRTAIGLILWNGLNLGLLAALIAAAYVQTREGAWYAEVYTPASYWAGVALGMLLVLLAALGTLTAKGRSFAFRVLASLDRKGNAAAPWPLLAITALALVAAVLLWSLPMDFRYLGALILVNLMLAITATLGGGMAAEARALGNAQWVLTIVLAAMLALTFFSAHGLPAKQPYGDEEAWTDMARNWLSSGQAYIRISGNAPALLVPGIGWWIAPYAGWLNLFGVSLAAGRLFSWALFAVGVASVGWLAARLYHPLTGWAAALLAASSLFVLEFRIIRPEIALLAGGALVAGMYAAGRKRAGWSFAAGLIAFLTLEFHASGIALVFALVFMHLSDALLALLARRNPFERRHFAAMVGVLLGAAIYVVLHILILPDPSSYAASLSSSRGFLSSLPSISTLLDDVYLMLKMSSTDFVPMGLAGLGFALRFGASDRLLLRFLAFTVVGFYLLVPSPPTPGHYLIIFAPFMLAGVAALLTLGWTRHVAPPRPALSALAAAVLCAPFIALALPVASLNPLPETVPTAAALRIRELASPEDTVVGNFGAYWDLLDYPNFYASQAEYEVKYRLGYSPLQLWTDLAPYLVFHTFRDTWDVPIPPVLRQYLEDERYRLVERLEDGERIIEIYQRPEN